MKKDKKKDNNQSVPLVWSSLRLAPIMKKDKKKDNNLDLFTAS